MFLDPRFFAFPKIRHAWSPYIFFFSFELSFFFIFIKSHQLFFFFIRRCISDSPTLNFKNYYQIKLLLNLLIIYNLISCCINAYKNNFNIKNFNIKKFVLLFYNFIFFSYTLILNFFGDRLNWKFKNRYLFVMHHMDFCEICKKLGCAFLPNYCTQYRILPNFVSMRYIIERMSSN